MSNAADDTSFSTSDKLDRSALCLHCALPVPAYRRLAARGGEFCCNGCAAVYQVLSSNNLDYYYRLQQESQGAGVPARSVPSQDELEFFDTLEFQDVHVKHYRDNGIQLAAIEVFLEGVHCPACVWLLEKLPTLLPGVFSVRVELGRSTAEIVFIPDEVRLSRIAIELARLGYRAHPYRGVNHKELRRKAERRLLSSMGIAGACAGNVMILSICLYSGIFVGIDQQYWSYFRWAAMLLTVPAFIFAGQMFFRRALAAIKLRQVHLDLPISLGLWAGFIGSVVNTIRGAGEVYFDSICVILFLLLVSRFIQFRAQNRSVEKAELLFSLMPSTVRRITADGAQECALEAIQVGDLIEVRAGERFPVDGLVKGGRSDVDLGLLTGESTPVSVGPVMPVYAGCSNITAPLEVSVTSTGELTRIGQLANLANQIQRNKPPVLHLVDRASKWFVGVVLTLACIAFIAGFSAGGLGVGVERLLALLIISCPCALGMATPLALSVGLGNAARAGIHLRSTVAIESVAKADTVVFDKTGTLTRGEFRVHEWWGDRELVPAIIAIEESSAHIVARAIALELRRAVGDSIDIPAIAAVEQHRQGISGLVNGEQLILGSIPFVEQSGARFSEESRKALERATEMGLTPIVVAQNGQVLAMIGLGDAVRTGVSEAIKSLDRRGFRSFIVSGDQQSAVNRVAELIGIPSDRALGGYSPESKAAFVAARQGEGKVMMFGDGVNDAGALAQADVGIGMYGGAEASFLVADGFFAKPDFSLVVKLVDGARATMRIVAVALALSLFFNLLGCSLAVVGFISPLVAAVLMPLSSLLVVGLAFSQRSFIR